MVCGLLLNSPLDEKEIKRFLPFRAKGNLILLVSQLNATRPC